MEEIFHHDEDKQGRKQQKEKIDIHIRSSNTGIALSRYISSVKLFLRPPDTKQDFVLGGFETEKLFSRVEIARRGITEAIRPLITDHTIEPRIEVIQHIRDTVFHTPLEYGDAITMPHHARKGAVGVYGTDSAH